MASYVAVHEPTARVVSLEGDDYEATGWQEHYIPAWRVVKSEIELAGVVLLMLLLLQKSKIMAVKVNLAGLCQFSALNHVDCMQNVPDEPMCAD